MDSKLVDRHVVSAMAKQGNKKKSVVKPRGPVRKRKRESAVDTTKITPVLPNPQPLKREKTVDELGDELEVEREVADALAAITADEEEEERDEKPKKRRKTGSTKFKFNPSVFKDALDEYFIARTEREKEEKKEKKLKRKEKKEAKKKRDSLTTTEKKTTKKNAWITHVDEFRAANPDMKYKEILESARATYTKVKREEKNACAKENPWMTFLHSYKTAHPDWKKWMNYGQVLKHCKSSYHTKELPCAPDVYEAPVVPIMAIDEL